MELLPVFIIVFVGISQAQEPLKVQFINREPRQVTVSSNLKFTCNINRDLLYAVSNNVEMIRQSDMGGNEVILTQAAKRVDAEPKYYNVVIPKPKTDDSISVEFEITEVRDLDEGYLICRATTVENGVVTEVAEDKVEIIVQRPLDVLYLKFDDLPAITKDLTDPIEIDRGNHTVTCIAEGSNPASTEVHLLFQNQQIDNVQTEIARMDDPKGVKKFRTTVKGIFTLAAAHSMQNFECVAISPLGIKHSVKLPIKIKVYDPKITCNDSAAYRGKPYPTLTCTVDYEGFIIKRFKYELGGKEAISEGTQNKDFAEVTRKQLGDTRAELVLNLYKAEPWHFNTPFYLVAEHEDGHETRATVRLSEVPENETEEAAETGRGASRGPGSSCSLLGASLATLIISIWSAVHVPL